MMKGRHRSGSDAWSSPFDLAPEGLCNFEIVSAIVYFITTNYVQYGNFGSKPLPKEGEDRKDNQKLGVHFILGAVFPKAKGDHA